MYVATAGITDSIWSWVSGKDEAQAQELESKAEYEKAVKTDLEREKAWVEAGKARESPPINWLAVGALAIAGAVTWRLIRKQR